MHPDCCGVSWRVVGIVVSSLRPPLFSFYWTIPAYRITKQNLWTTGELSKRPKLFDAINVYPLLVDARFLRRCDVAWSPKLNNIDQNNLYR